MNDFSYQPNSLLTNNLTRLPSWQSSSLGTLLWGPSSYWRILPPHGWRQAPVLLVQLEQPLESSTLSKRKLGKLHKAKPILQQFSLRPEGGALSTMALGKSCDCVNKSLCCDWYKHSSWRLLWKFRHLYHTPFLSIKWAVGFSFRVSQDTPSSDTPDAATLGPIKDLLPRWSFLVSLALHR